MLDLVPQRDFLVGIDSDGCVFDTMELKHKECFIPNMINTYELQAVSKYAREAAEFVNLYSKTRGINRFPSVVETLRWLAKHPEVQARGQEIRLPAGLVNWLKTETTLANATLAAAVERTKDPDLVQALAWSEAVNAAIERFVRGVPPFPGVLECLEKLAPQADLLVVSATPSDALRREWSEHGIERYVRAICGQDQGTKKQVLAVAAKYPSDHVLMVGDAPGDYQAAVANQALFFPINPGAEAESWRNLFEEGIERFLAGTFAGDYQARLLEDFDRRLPASPTWAE